jgi:hypothetical protein
MARPTFCINTNSQEKNSAFIHLKIPAFSGDFFKSLTLSGEFFAHTLHIEMHERETRLRSLSMQKQFIPKRGIVSLLDLA